MVRQPGGRREKLFEGGSLANLALLRLPAVSAGIQILVKKASDVKFIEGIGLRLLGNFFRFLFQEGLVAVIVSLRGFFALLFQDRVRSEEHTSELQSRFDLVCRLLLEKKKQ